MSEALRKSSPQTCGDSINVTSSLALGAGHLLSDSPESQTTGQSGREAVHVSRFRARDSGKELPINDISGPLFIGLSQSAILQSSLESRLRANLEGNGSPLYVLTWKHWDMPAGVPISRLRASARRTSANVSSGWPTPIDNDHRKRETCVKGQDGKLSIAVLLVGWPTPRASVNETIRQDAAMRDYQRTDTGKSLAVTAQVMLTGWSTPRSTESGHTTGNPERALTHRSRLEDQVFLAGWATPHAPREHDSDHSAFRWNPNVNQDNPMMQILGRDAGLSDVPMEKRGQLNPGIFPLADGIPGRVGRLRAYGNAIVPQLAAVFVQSALEAINDVEGR